MDRLGAQLKTEARSTRRADPSGAQPRSDPDRNFYHIETQGPRLAAQYFPACEDTPYSGASEIEPDRASGEGVGS